MVEGLGSRVSAGIPNTLLLRIEAAGFPNFWASISRFLARGSGPLCYDNSLNKTMYTNHIIM